MDDIENILKCNPSVDEAAVATLEGRYRLILQQPDNKLVAFSDPTEVERVKNDFLKKKLGLTDEAAIAAALAHMGQLMSDEIDKNRLTVYYVLADHFGKLDAIKALDDSGTTPREGAKPACGPHGIRSPPATRNAAVGRGSPNGEGAAFRASWPAWAQGTKLPCSATNG